MKNILNITQKEAEEFIALLKTEDSNGLKYLRNILEINKSNNGAIRIVRAALELNAYNELMELDDIPYDFNFYIIYRRLMDELLKHAQDCAKNSTANN